MSSPNSPPDIPLLTDAVANGADDLPVLTEIAPATAQVPDPVTTARPPDLPQALATYLDTVFADKLKAHLAIAQEWAIEAAISETKNDLAQLLDQARNRTGSD